MHGNYESDSNFLFDQKQKNELRRANVIAKLKLSGAHSCFISCFKLSINIIIFWSRNKCPASVLEGTAIPATLPLFVCSDEEATIDSH